MSDPNKVLTDRILDMGRSLAGLVYKKTSKRYVVGAIIHEDWGKDDKRRPVHLCQNPFSPVIYLQHDRPEDRKLDLIANHDFACTLCPTGLLLEVVLFDKKNRRDYYSALQELAHEYTVVIVLHFYEDGMSIMSQKYFTPRPFRRFKKRS